MTENPRQILAEAGVECPAEVERVFLGWLRYPEPEQAILALARLVAKYKWQRDLCLYTDPSYVKRVDESEEDYLERRWAEHQA